MTKKIYGLLGRDISYSLSPRMHNAAFDYFGIEAEYVLFDKEEEELEDFFQELLSGSLGGINITIPYKVKIKDMLENNKACTLHKEADCIGAVNTIKVHDLKVTGFNTDGAGFYASLIEDAGFNISGKNIFIIGAGGAGRAILKYLAFIAKEKAKKIYIYDVDESQTSSLGKIAEIVTREKIKDTLAKSSLVINATPLGTKEGGPLPLNADYLQKGMTVYDLVYARETELVRLSREKGLKAVNGLGMLVNQAALAFNIWTSKPLEEIKRIIRGALPEDLKRVYGWNA